MRLDLKENIVFPFSDPSWISKTLIGVACQLFFPVMPALMGYQLAIIRQTANGEDEKLPEFEGFGNLWVTGFKMMLGFMLLLLVPTGATVAMAVTGLMAMNSDGGASALGWMAWLAIPLIALCYFILIAFLPAMMLRYAMTDSMSAFFDFPALLSDIRQGVGDYLVIVLLPMAVSLAMGIGVFFTVGLAAILVYPLTVLVMFVQARMLGNYHRLYFM